MQQRARHVGSPDVGVTHQFYSTICKLLLPIRSTHLERIIPRSFIFSTCRSRASSSWLALLLLKSGDIESNPGPTHNSNTSSTSLPLPQLTSKSSNPHLSWKCNTCNKIISRNQCSILCNYPNQNHWIHEKCSNITRYNHNNTWICNSHSNTNNIPPNTTQSSLIPTATNLMSLPGYTPPIKTNKSNTTNTHLQIWTCDICNKTIIKNQCSILCNHLPQNHWVHEKCSKINRKSHHNTWICKLHSSNNTTNTKLPSSSQPTPSSSLTTPLIHTKITTNTSSSKHSHKTKNSTHITTNKQQRHNKHTNQTTKTQHTNKTNTKKTKKPSKPKIKNPKLKILQLNINGIQNKTMELQKLLTDQNIDIALIQESKLNSSSKTPYILNYSNSRQDRQNSNSKQKLSGGGLIIYIKNNLPWGTLPVLEVNGVKIGQSSAICRLLAHRFNLAGKDDVEKAKCDEYVDAIRDFGNEFRALMSCEDEVKKGEMMKKLKEVTVPLYLGKFEMILQTQDKKYGSKWLVGKSVTWADVVVAHFLTLIETRSKIPMTASFPSIKKMMDDFYAIKEIKEWIAVRPATD